MVNTSCISLFKTLSESEVKEFGSYLTTFYQKPGSIYKLYNYLKKCHPIFTNEKLERKYVEKKLFKEKADPERTLFDATSKLTAKLKSFITIQELEQQEVYKNFLYLEALKSRKLDGLFFKKAERLQKEWDDESIPGIEHFHNQYKLKVLNLSHPNFSNQKIKKTSELKNIIDLLDQFYATSKIYYTLINDINNKLDVIKKYSVEKLLKDLEEITAAKNKTKLLHNFLIAYQSNCLEKFKQIKFKFFNSHKYFTQSEKHDLVSILNYFFYSKLHAKQEKANILKELFEIVKFSLKEGLLLEDGYLSNQSFDNCIQFAKANNEIEWIEKFIHDYKDLLNEKEKENYLKFGEFIVLFFRNRFEDALAKLSFINIKKPIRIAQLNCCKIQCLYELKYEEAFYYAINSSNQYLFNHKDDLNKNHNFSMFKSFLNIIRRVNSIESNNNITNTKKIDQLKAILNQIIIAEVKPYDDKWLILIIKRLFKRYSL